jgi:toxin ParE1/3/4
MIREISVKLCGKKSPKGFNKYLVFYLSSDSGIEILRVIYGEQDIEAILDEKLG